MDKTMKAQASTEMIIILSITLVLVSIGILVFTDFAQDRSAVQRGSEEINLMSYDVGIRQFTLSPKGLSMRLVNNHGTPITIHSITADATTQNNPFLPMTLVPGEERTFETYDTIKPIGESYNTPLVIQYTQAGAQKQQRIPSLHGSVHSLENYELSHKEAIGHKMLLLAHFNNKIALSENATKFVDEVQRLAATCTNCPTIVDEGFTTALAFNGVDTSIVFPTTFSGADALTVSTWHYTESGAIQMLYDIGLSIGQGIATFVVNENVANFITTNETMGEYVEATDVLLPNTWNNIIVSFANNTFTTYVNGVFQDSEVLDGTIFPISGNFTIGMSGGSLYFDGYIDEVAVWNRTLTQAEINSIYNRGKVHFNLQ